MLWSARYQNAGTAAKHSKLAASTNQVWWPASAEERASSSGGRARPLATRCGAVRADPPAALESWQPAPGSGNFVYLARDPAQESRRVRIRIDVRQRAPTTEILQHHRR